MPTTLLRGMTGARRRTSSRGTRTPVGVTGWYSGSPCTSDSTSRPSSSSTMPNVGSSPVVYLAMRTGGGYRPGPVPLTGDRRPRGARRPRARRERVEAAGAGARGPGRFLDCGTPRPRPAGRAASGGRLPVDVLQPSAEQASALAPRCRRGTDRCGGRAPDGLAVVPRGRRRGDDGRRRFPRRARRPGALRARPARGYGRPTRPARLLRAARVGDGLRPAARPAAARGLAVAADTARDGCGGGVAAGALHALRRVPVLHAAGPWPELSATVSSTAGGAGAARMPACRDGSLQAFVQADAGGAVGAGAALLRVGAGGAR